MHLELCNIMLYEIDEEKKKQKNFKNSISSNYASKNTIKSVKSQSMEWGKNICISHSYTGLISRI